jgi:hypothetical protein
MVWNVRRRGALVRPTEKQLVQHKVLDSAVLSNLCQNHNAMRLKFETQTRMGIK